MDEKTIDTLSDEKLESVAGGGGEQMRVLTCRLCRVGKVAVSPHSSEPEECPHCHALMLISNGRLQQCVEQKTQPAPDLDKEDCWL